jgi:prefoldin subunit 5
MTNEQELGSLQEQAEAIKGQLDQIEARIRDLEGKE